MAKKISSSDLFSQEDLFKGVRDSAQSALVMINQLNAAMKTSAEGLKASIKGADLGSASGLKGFNQAASEANQLKEEAIRLEIMQKKLTAEMEAAEKSRIATERERLKLENDLAKAAARAAKSDADKDSAYKALVKSTRDLKNASKELAAQLLVLEKSGQSGTDEFKNLSKQYDDVTKSASEADQQLKEIDKSVGDSFRNVGNYESAIDGIGKSFTSAKQELSALTKEILNMKRGTPEFEAARQRASELKDEIKSLSQELNSGAGNAFEQISGSARLFGERLLGLNLKGAGAALTNMGSAVRGIDFKTIKTEVGGLGKGLLDLGKAILANPVFLLGAVIAGIIVYWKELTDLISGKTGMLDSLKEQEGVLKSQEQSLNRQKALQTALKAGAGQMLKLEYSLLENKKNQSEVAMEIAALEEDQVKYLEAEQAKLEAINAIEIQRIQVLTSTSALIDKIRSAKDDEYNKQVLQNQVFAEYKSQTELIAVEQERNGERIKQLDLDIYQAKLMGNEALAGRLLLDKQGLEYQNVLMQNDRDEIYNEGIKAKQEVKTEEELRKIEERKAARAKSKSERDAASKKLAEEILAIEQRMLEIQRSTMPDKEREILILEEKQAAELKTYERAKKSETELAELKTAHATEMKMLTDKYDKEAQDKLNEKLQKEREAAQERLHEKQLELIELNALEEKAADENYLATLSDEQRELIAVRDYYFELKTLAEANGVDISELKKEQARKEKEISDKYRAEEKEAAIALEKEKQKELNDSVKAGTDLFVKQSERKQAQVQKDLDNAQKQYDKLKLLAESGNIDAQQSLAEQQRIIDEKERQRMAEMKRQERIKLAQSIFSTYSAKLESGDKNALANTIKDATILTQFVQSLPAFLKGTEDTGVNGYGVDGKGGFLSVLHPNERVVPKELNSKMSGITNEELAKIAVAYKTNEFMTSIPAFQQADSSELISRIDNLTKVLKDKPETNIALGEIMQGAMEIVQTTKRGNKTVYNRYRVK
jgi:hypothetical protein